MSKTCLNIYEIYLQTIHLLVNKCANYKIILSSQPYYLTTILFNNHII